MGVEVTMALDSNKSTISAASVATALATYPAVNNIRVVTILAAADFHRQVEIGETVRRLVNYARDNNVFTGSGSIAIVGNLNRAVRVEAVAANVVTGDIALMILGSERSKGSRNFVDNAYQQILDWMRENQRLVA